MRDISELFPTGPPLSETAQIGRGGLIGGLERRTRSGEKIKMFATRRTGKTSAARATILRISADELPAANVEATITPTRPGSSRRKARSASRSSSERRERP